MSATKGNKSEKKMKARIPILNFVCLFVRLCVSVQYKYLLLFCFVLIFDEFEAESMFKCKRNCQLTADFS